MSELSTLGFIGLGVMGHAMASNLTRKSGRPVVVHDRSEDAINTVVAAGATAAGSNVAVAEASDIVFLSLPSIVQVEEVCEELAGAESKPRVIVDMSTSDVERTRALSLKLADAGIELVDAPVARLRQAAIDGTLLITVGSTEERFAELNPLLSTMGSDVIHAGGTGNGQVMKIMNNMVVFQTFNALAEAAAIGQAAGVDKKLLLETLSLGSADSFLLRKSALATLAVDSFPVKTFPTLYAIKDLGLALQLAADTGIDATSAKATMSLLEQTRDAGFELEYYPIMVKLIEQTSRSGDSE